MASSTTSLINNTFAGIRRKNSSFSSECISCSDCQNIELFYTKLNSGVGIRTAKGNVAVSKAYNDVSGLMESIVPVGENIIGIFESYMDNDTYFFVYTENDIQGKLYTFDINSITLTEQISGLEVTGMACGESFTQGWLDMFIFSNGVNVKYLYCSTETHAGLTVESDENIKLIDVDGRPVKGLGLKVFDSRLWIFDGKVLWYSQQADCRVFNFVDPEKVTSAGYIEFVKPITAIYPYLGSLAVFHKDSSVLVQLDATTMFKKEDESPGGCASYDSLVFHGTDLYFYDDTKKGVFSFKQIINGDKTLGENIALDVQDELMDIQAVDTNKIRALSVVTSDRNEVWFLVPISYEEGYSYVLIFDYLRGEWIKRKCQTINCLGLVNSRLYSAGKDIYEEYVSNYFDGEFIDAYYTCSIFNLDADNTLKITKFPPRATCDGSYRNHFWIKYVKNYNPLKSPKIKEIVGKSYGGILTFDTEDCWDTDLIYQPNNYNAILKLPSATFKALEITLYTTNASEDFCIKELEYSRIKVKQV